MLFFCLGVGAGGSFLSFSVPAGSGKKMLGYGLLGGVSTQADAMRENELCMNYGGVTDHAFSPKRETVDTKLSFFAIDDGF